MFPKNDLMDGVFFHIFHVFKWHWSLFSCEIRFSKVSNANFGILHLLSNYLGLLSIFEQLIRRFELEISLPSIALDFDCAFPVMWMLSRERKKQPCNPRELFQVVSNCLIRRSVEDEVSFEILKFCPMKIRIFVTLFPAQNSIVPRNEQKIDSDYYRNSKKEAKWYPHLELKESWKNIWRYKISGFAQKRAEHLKLCTR